ncbi:hypothetical protein L2E82_29019 [Cichorium intybus]|uniref:Uncharacterized protein n=1 Tax=Cichorium intybus TaxID=13427 RepID=A0ACB9CWX7_CICIN|nr:hypothetical protein L2E82_29019 [Cichorium intybus]
MAVFSHLRQSLLRSQRVTPASGVLKTFASPYHHVQTKNKSTAFTKAEDQKSENKKGKWLTLLPFNLTVNGASLGKDIVGRGQSTIEGDGSSTTMLKWVMRCCPQLPRSLVQKLFRLRQVQRETSVGSNCDQDVQALGSRVKRVSAKDSMKPGDIIHLPNQYTHYRLRKQSAFADSAIIVINKPPGIPVQRWQ